MVATLTDLLDFDYSAATAARDQGISLVQRKAWMEDGLARIRQLGPWEGISEDWRVKFLGEGMAPPHHKNAWGALAKVAQAHGLIEWTGRIRNMKTEKSHARGSYVWRTIGEALAYRPPAPPPLTAADWHVGIVLGALVADAATGEVIARVCCIDPARGVLTGASGRWYKPAELIVTEPPVAGYQPWPGSPFC